MPLKGVRGDQNLDGSGHESARNWFERRFSGLSKPPGALSRRPRPLSRPRNEQSRRRRALSKAPEGIERTQKGSKGFGMHRKGSKGLSRTKSVIRRQKVSFEMAETDGIPETYDGVRMSIVRRQLEMRCGDN